MQIAAREEDYALASRLRDEMAPLTAQLHPMRQYLWGRVQALHGASGKQDRLDAISALGGDSACQTSLCLYDSCRTASGHRLTGSRPEAWCHGVRVKVSFRLGQLLAVACSGSDHRTFSRLSSSCMYSVAALLAQAHPPARDIPWHGM